MIVEENKTGQTCNQMIEFMHLYVDAIEYSHDLVLTDDFDFYKYFTSSSVVRIKRRKSINATCKTTKNCTKES